MLFSNLLVAIALTVLFPLGLMGMLAASEWLERRTLATEEVVPRRLRRMERKPPEAVEAMVLEETAHVVSQYWSATGRPASSMPVDGDRRPATPDQRPADEPEPPAGEVGNGAVGGRHLRRAAGGRAGRHERRR
jgi:hypothetical protein